MATETTDKKEENKTPREKARYYGAVGGRKSAVARVRLSEGGKTGERSFVVNGRDVHVYFSTENTRLIAREALQKVKTGTRFDVSARIEGGGQHAQAEALRHGISRALILINEEWRNRLKKSGFLKRDPREKERRKFGLKKARKAPQWSKR